MITRVSSVIRPKGSDLIFDHPYNAEYLPPVLRRSTRGAHIVQFGASGSGVCAAPAHRALGLHAVFPAPPEMVRRGVKQLVMWVGLMALASGKHSRRALCVAGSGQGRARLGPGPAGLRWLGRDAQIPSAPNDLPQCLGGCSCWLDAKPDLFTRSGVDLLPGTAGPADLCSYCVRPGLDVNRHGLPRLDAPARYVVYFQGVGPQGIAVMAARPGEDDLCALFHEANDYTSVVARCAQLTGPADQAPA
jgi:hypothetical protein